MVVSPESLHGLDNAYRVSSAVRENTHTQTNFFPESNCGSVQNLRWLHVWFFVLEKLNRCEVMVQRKLACREIKAGVRGSEKVDT